MVDLRLSDEQDQLRSVCRSLFGRGGDSHLARAAEPSGHLTELWDSVVEIGLVEMALPEDVGGAGASLLDVALVCEIVGEFLAPIPIVESVVAGRALAAIQHPRAHELVGQIVAGSAVATLAIRRPEADVLRWVPAGAAAGHVIFSDGDAVYLVSIPSSVATPANLGSLAVAHVGVAGAEVVGTGPEVHAVFEHAVAEWRTLTAAVLVGAALRSLDLGVAYTREREAFGVPIASFQSIAHRLADLATAAQGAQLLARKAAWSCDARRHDAVRLGAMAYLYAGDTAEQVAVDVLHFHGGYGFTLEYDIQLFLRRIKALACLGGDPQRGLAELASTVFG